MLTGYSPAMTFFASRSLSSLILKPIQRPISKPFTRSFFGIDSSNQSVQKYHIKKVFGFSPETLYTAIADVDSYDQFLPYCQKSTITSTDPETNLPTRATLDVGWGNFFEKYESILTYTSRFRSTSSYSADPSARTEYVDPDKNITKKSVTAEAANSTMFKKLYTKWTIMPVPKHPEKCAVNFELEFCFNSNLYNAVSKNFGPSLAEVMVKAFTERAKELDKIQQKA